MCHRISKNVACDTKGPSGRKLKGDKGAAFWPDQAEFSLLWEICEILHPQTPSNENFPGFPVRCDVQSFHSHAGGGSPVIGALP
jgi:hypothetical protein